MSSRESFKSPHTASRTEILICYANKVSSPLSSFLFFFGFFVGMCNQIAKFKSAKKRAEFFPSYFFISRKFLLQKKNICLLSFSLLGEKLDVCKTDFFAYFPSESSSRSACLSFAHDVFIKTCILYTIDSPTSGKSARKRDEKSRTLCERESKFQQINCNSCMLRTSKDSALFLCNHDAIMQSKTNCS